MAVLYRKYRPQIFAEVLNQKYIIQTLKNQVASGSVAHAYLFTGSRGVGKTSAARILAKAVNCLESSKQTAVSSKQGDACGECSVCKAVENGNFIDLVEIDAASNTGVDNIRELIEHVKFAPTMASFKVFIIDEVHMLSKGAFNALLKTLEEPPKHAIFILATTEINKVPATIVSRTQRFDFKALSAADILSHLKAVVGKEGLKIQEDVLQLVAQNAEGSVRDSLSLLGKVLTLGEQSSLDEARDLLGVTDLATCAKLLEFMAEGKTAEIPEFFEKLSERGVDYIIFNKDFLEFLRKVLIYKITQQGDIAVSQAAEKLSVNDLIFIIRLFLKSFKDLSGSPLPQVPLLVAAMEGALRKSSGTVNKLISESVNKQVAPKPVVQSLAPKVEQSDTTQPTETPEATLEEAMEFWPKVIAKIKDINGPLASMLRNTQLSEIQSGKLVLSVKFKFDKQSLELPKNYDLICKSIFEISGKRLGVVGEIAKQEEAQPSSGEALAEALKVFGGELVE